MANPETRQTGRRRSAPAQVTSSPRKTRKKGPDHVPFWKVLASAGAGTAGASQIIMLGYVALYATDTLGLRPAVIGGIVAVATLLSSLTSLVAAWVIDRSPVTRWGKARPWELALPAMWLGSFLVFAVPSGLDVGAKTVWITIALLVTQTILVPLQNANENLYMARAFGSRLAIAKIVSGSSLIVTLSAVVLNVVLPPLLNAAGDSADEWRSVVGVLAVVMGLLGTTRVFLIKEKYPKEVGVPPVRFREMILALRTTPWIWFLCALRLFGSMATAGTVGAYYFRYIVGDLSLQGALNLVGLVITPVLLLLPWLMKRFAYSQIIVGSAVLGIIGALLNGLAMGSIPLLIIGGFLVGVASLPMSYLSGLLVLDIASYNEWQGKRRLESTMSAVVGVASAIGAAIASGLVGWIMDVTGYDADLAEQPASAVQGINALFAWVPLAIFAVVAILMQFYSRFDRKLLPVALAELEERAAAAPHDAELPAVPPVPSEAGAGPAAGIPSEMLAASVVEAENEERDE